MNEKAVELGLTTTHYADPSGLLSENVSSAYDMARLIAFASSDERISTIMQKSQHTIQTPRRAITFRSTNHLLGREDVEVRAGKTGFITQVGLLPRDAAAAAHDRPAGGGGRPRRALERRPVPGSAEPVQLVLRKGADDLRDAGGCDHPPRLTANFRFQISAVGASREADSRSAILNLNS